MYSRDVSKIRVNEVCSDDQPCMASGQNTPQEVHLGELREPFAERPGNLIRKTHAPQEILEARGGTHTALPFFTPVTFHLLLRRFPIERVDFGQGDVAHHQRRIIRCQANPRPRGTPEAAGFLIARDQL